MLKLVHIGLNDGAPKTRNFKPRFWRADAVGTTTCGHWFAAIIVAFEVIVNGSVGPFVLIATNVGEQPLAAFARILPSIVESRHSKEI